MIRRINTLKNVGRFSTLHTTSGTQGDFGELNVIYAENACGKSTLCDVLRSVNTGNAAYIVGRKSLGVSAPQDIGILLNDNSHPIFINDSWSGHDNCPPIYIYDERFIADNVYIGHHISTDQKKNLYGLVLGSQAITLKQAVDSAEQALKNAKNTYDREEKILSTLLSVGYDINSFRGIPAVDDIEHKIEKATKALRSAEQTKDKTHSIRTRPLLSPLPIFEVPENLEEVLKATLDTAAIAAEEKIKQHLAKDSQGLSVSWVKQGFELQSGTTCPYCGQDMQDLNILAAYRSYFSGELQRQEELRESLRNALQLNFGAAAQTKIRQILTAHKTEQDWWKAAVGYEVILPEIGDIEDICGLLQSTHDTITAACDRKQSKLCLEICLSPEEKDAMHAWQAKAATLQQYNAELSKINVEIQRRQESAATIDTQPLQQSIAALNASKKRHEQNTIAAYSAYDTAHAQYKEAQKIKKVANDALRDQAQHFFDEYGQKINGLLELFNVDFKIISEKLSFPGGTPSGQLVIEMKGVRVSASADAASDPSKPSLANTLSGGDRSALALAFFLAKVELSSDAANSIVVFDDPYHNQDRSRRQCTIERIHHLATIAKQCFVFSHDLDFARTIEKCHAVSNKKTFVLKPHSGRVTLEARNLPPLPSQTYTQSYNLLHSYTQSLADYTDRLEQVVRTIRPILEEYFRWKYPKEFSDNDWLGDIISKIRGAQSGSPLSYAQPLVTELTNINEYSKRFHHGATGSSADQPNARELLTFVRRTLQIIHG